MSILNNQPQPQPQPNQNELAANKLKSITQITFSLMKDAFNKGSKEFWGFENGTTPSEVASFLGSDAAEVFYLHARLGELIALVQPEAIQEGLSLVGQFTINEDGTVTVIESPPEQ